MPYSRKRGDANAGHERFGHRLAIIAADLEVLGQVGVQPLQRPQQVLFAEADGRHERDRIARHRRRLEAAIGDQRMRMHEQAQVTAKTPDEATPCIRAPTFMAARLPSNIRATV